MTISGTGQKVNIRVDAAVENQGLFCSGSAKRKTDFFVGSDIFQNSIDEKMVKMARFEFATSAPQQDRRLTTAFLMPYFTPVSKGRNDD
tara:strand:- start:89 stop:355 length:267 start_codon:yes stop_codon:yes gene_type:complete